jgi:hypothetical protein
MVLPVIVEPSIVTVPPGRRWRAAVVGDLDASMARVPS